MILWIEASRHKFQFTPLREGRRKQRLALINGIVNFNSRPCVRGDRVGDFCKLRRFISIHAPA